MSWKSKTRKCFALLQRQEVITLFSLREREIRETLPFFDNVAETYLQCTTACDLLILEDSYCCNVFIASD